MEFLRPSLLLFITVPMMGFGVERSTPRTAAVELGRRQAPVGQFDRVIPLVLNGNGFKTSFVLTNLDSKTVYFDLFFNASDGSLIEFPISGLGATARVYGTIPVNQTILLETDGSGDLKEGYVAFYSLDRPADDPKAAVALTSVGGMAVIRANPADQPSFESTVPIVPAYETRFTLPFDNRSGTRTGVVLLNSSTKPSPVKITFRDASGKVLAQDSATLDAFQSVTVVLPEIYPQTADQAGVLQVSTSAIGLSGLGLRIDTSGRFTTVQTLSTVMDPDAPKLPAPVPTGTLPGVGNSCASIEGALVFANDGQYLGKITSNTADSDSLGNLYGKYGSAYSSVSVFNQYGTYGGQYSALSPFNPYTNTPPVMFLGNKAVAFLTANRNKTPGVDPTAIYPCIGRR